MTERFADILLVGEHRNSLGRAEEVVQTILTDPSRLEELYECISNDDAWVRMRAVDSFEKVCRVHPEWIEPYIDRLFNEFGNHPQPSIQWHIAEIVAETTLNADQEDRAISWLVDRLNDPQIDWIVAANSMNSLAHFVDKGSYDKSSYVTLLAKQQNHQSKSVVKRATKILNTLQ